MRLNSKQLERLLTEHRAPLRLLASTICQSPEDAVQQAFVKLATLSDAPPNPAAWLYRVVKNNSISQLRSESRRKERERTVGAEKFRRQLFEDSGSEIDTDLLANALQQLDHESRQVVVARIWGKLSFDVIATECDCSSSTAHRRYKDALNQMREILGLSNIEKLAEK